MASAKGCVGDIRSQEEGTMMLTVVDLFCGAGGLSAGFAKANFTVSENSSHKFQLVYGVDKDKDAIKSFRKHHFAHLSTEQAAIVAPEADIATITGDSIRAAISPLQEVDVVIGGPSCQGLSAAGLRNPQDPRNQMLRAFIRIVGELEPKWFVLENVPGLTHANNRELLAAIFEEFEQIGGGKYRVAGDVLLAADYGVPQLRYRLFVIGTRLEDVPIRFPPETHVSPTETRPLFKEKSYVTVRQAIGDLSALQPKVLEKNAVPKPEANGTTLIHNHYCIGLTDLNQSRIANIQQGADWREMQIGLLPERYFATRASDQKGAYGRLDWDWCAYTVTSGVCNVTAGPFTHPEKDRSLSVREAARLQTFDDDHVFVGSVSSQYRQVGNAVPVRLAQAVAEAILYCHFKPNEASGWGKAGRISTKLLCDSLQGHQEMPTMTPRQLNPYASRYDHRDSQKKNSKTITKKKTFASVWDANMRRPDPYPKDTAVLRSLSNEPGNYRTTKRARAIVEFIDGVDKSIIIANANVSAKSIKKWVDGYFQDGIDGWRAYHSTTRQIAGDDGVLRKKLSAAIKKVRRVVVASSAKKNTHKRHYMNKYLRGLKERFSTLTIYQVIQHVEELVGYGIGTVYIGDLLAIYDVVLQHYDAIPHRKLQ